MIILEILLICLLKKYMKKLLSIMNLVVGLGELSIYGLRN